MVGQTAPGHRTQRPPSGMQKNPSRAERYHGGPPRTSGIRPAKSKRRALTAPPSDRSFAPDYISFCQQHQIVAITQPNRVETCVASRYKPDLLPFPLQGATGLTARMSSWRYPAAVGVGFTEAVATPRERELEACAANRRPAEPIGQGRDGAVSLGCRRGGARAARPCPCHGQRGR